MQEENLLPQGEITVRKVIRPSWIGYDKKMIKCNQLDLNGKRIVNWMSEDAIFGRMKYFDDHNPSLAYREYNWAGLQRAKRAMKECSIFILTYFTFSFKYQIVIFCVQYTIKIKKYNFSHI